MQNKSISNITGATVLVFAVLQARDNKKSNLQWRPISVPPAARSGIPSFVSLSDELIIIVGMAVKQLSWECLKAYPFEIKVELMMIQPQGRGSGEVSSFGGKRSASVSACMRVFSQMRHREEQKKHFSR